MGLTRRQFLSYAAIAATARAKTTQAKPDGFFTLGPSATTTGGS